MTDLVLSSYLPGEGHYQSKLYKVIPVLCDDDRGYWRGFAKYWEQPLSIVAIEHDVEVTDSQVNELLACKYSLCAFAYPIHWASSGNPNEVFPHTKNGTPIEPGEEWAEWSAIGCLKMTPESRIAPLLECTWRRVEDAINAAVSGPFHIHWDYDEDGIPSGLPHHHW